MNIQPTLRAHLTPSAISCIYAQECPAYSYLLYHQALQNLLTLCAFESIGSCHGIVTTEALSKALVMELSQWHRVKQSRMLKSSEFLVNESYNGNDI